MKIKKKPIYLLHQRIVQMSLNKPFQLQLISFPSLSWVSEKSVSFSSSSFSLVFSYTSNFHSTVSFSSNQFFLRRLAMDIVVGRRHPSYHPLLPSPAAWKKKLKNLLLVNPSFVSPFHTRFQFYLLFDVKRSDIFSPSVIDGFVFYFFFEGSGWSRLICSPNNKRSRLPGTVVPSILGHCCIGVHVSICQRVCVCGTLTHKFQDLAWGRLLCLSCYH